VHAADLLELDTMNRATELTKALDEPITDGRYRLYNRGCVISAIPPPSGWERRAAWTRRTS